MKFGMKLTFVMAEINTVCIMGSFIHVFKCISPKIVEKIRWLVAALSQSGEISPDFCCFYGSGIRHNEDIMHSFQNFIVRLIPNHSPPLETRIWKLVVRALVGS